MIDPTWHRIGAIHAEKDGTVGAVWLAWDQRTNVLHLYDAARFEKGLQSVFAVISEGVASRGRHYPVAWRKEDEYSAKKLTDGGVNMIGEPVDEDQAVAEALNREIWQRMMSSQFRVDQSVHPWLLERRNFIQEKGLVPLDGFPLLSATRHAVQRLDYAMPEKSQHNSGPNHPQVKVL